MTFGTQEQIHYKITPSQLDSVLVAQSKKGICATLIGDDAKILCADLKSHFSNAVIIEGGQTLEELAFQIAAFIDDPTKTLDIDLDIRGTDFQKRVWDILRKIPVGATTNYTEVAKCLQAPSAVRAVAGACAANVLAVII